MKMSINLLFKVVFKLLFNKLINKNLQYLQLLYKIFIFIVIF